jgi:peptidoglycan L-alanyl-D-glutamate endopeptidase CwlK
MFTFSESSKNTLLSVDNRLQAVCFRALEISKIDFGIPSSGGYRTEEEQNKLFSLGKSNCDGYEKKSYHQTGMAVDVYAYVDGKASWDKDHLTHVAAAMMQSANELSVKLEWGGFWGFVDMPHFQITDNE